MKKFLKIEYILLLCSLLISCANIIFKQSALKHFETVNTTISLIQLKEQIPDDFENIFLPFSYFNMSIEKKLSDISLFLTDNSTVNRNELIEMTLSLQKEISLAQNRLLFGYDCLLYCSILLTVISVFVIVYKNFKIKNDAIRKDAINEAQLNFSRDLHDGVAQDLAALKLYVSNEDKEKSSFYADQAFREVRYLIDSLHLDFNDNFENVVKDTISSFSSNYEIEASFLCASIYLNKLKSEDQLEILRILQESLSNIARHANATKVTVKITDVGSSINIIISDNGKGFNLEKLNLQKDKANHYGLKNITERVHKLGGTVDFISSEGTTIAIVLKNIIH